MTAAWVPCPCCQEYWCMRHGCHAFECECPAIQEWTTDPYSDPDDLTPNEVDPAPPASGRGP